MAYSDGDNFINGAFLSYQQGNRMKNNWRAASPVSNPQAGMLFFDSDDNSLWVYTGAAWLLIGYAKAISAVQWLKGADIASASTLTITHAANAGNYFDVTGTTGITRITMTDIGGSNVQAGTVLKLHFDSSLKITHDGDYLVLFGGRDMVVAAGDEVEFVCYAAGKWRAAAWVSEAVMFQSLDCVAGISHIRYPALIPDTEVDTASILTKTATQTGITNKTFDSPTTDDLLFSGQSMQAETSGNEGRMNYANDTNRKAVGGRLIEFIRKSPDDANYIRELLGAAPDCVELFSIITV